MLHLYFSVAQQLIWVSAQIQKIAVWMSNLPSPASPESQKSNNYPVHDGGWIIGAVHLKLPGGILLSC